MLKFKLIGGAKKIARHVKMNENFVLFLDKIKEKEKFSHHFQKKVILIVADLHRHFNSHFLGRILTKLQPGISILYTGNINTYIFAPSTYTRIASLSFSLSRATRKS